MVQIISYDLNKSGKNYAGVIQAIKDAGIYGWCKPLESTWLIKTNLSPNDVSDRIKAQADSDDKWIVFEVVDNKQGWLSKDQWDYINGTLFK